MKQHLIIFEGIATSGKSTLCNLLANLLNKKSRAMSITDERTLMPIFENKDVGVATDHLIRELAAMTKLEAEYIVLERTHLTHVFRTKTALREFAQVESFIIEHFEPRIILLTVHPSVIQARITHADEQRGDSWSQKKSGSIAERAQYYTDQQNILRTALHESKIISHEVDTTEKNWGAALSEITNWLGV